MEALTNPIVEPVPPPRYHLKWFNNRGQEITRTATNWERLQRWFQAGREHGGANFRKYSEDGGRTWTDY